MNKYFKSFLHRGAVFGGFGPIIAGIVYLILQFTLEDFLLSGTAAFTAILSTYLLAFVHAGASVFNQIENWPLAKSLLCHFGVLYLAYTFCYFVNSWIPFDPKILLIYTLIFIAVYFLICLIVFMAIKYTSRGFNAKL